MSEDVFICDNPNHVHISVSLLSKGDDVLSSYYINLFYCSCCINLFYHSFIKMMVIISARLTRIPHNSIHSKILLYVCIKTSNKNKENYPLAMFLSSHPAMLLTSTRTFLHNLALLSYFASCLANASPNLFFRFLTSEGSTS